MPESYPGGDTAALTTVGGNGSAQDAMGMIVRIEPSEFSRLLARAEAPLVIYCYGKRVFSPKHQYLMHYKGLVFYAEAETPLDLPRTAEILTARSITPTA